MFKFCAAICFGVMLGMGGVALAEEELVELRDPDEVFPENEPPIFHVLPLDLPLDPDEVFPNEEPPLFSLTPPEFPVAPVDDGLNHASPQFNPALLPPNEPRMMDLIISPAIPVTPEDGDLIDGLQVVANGVVSDFRDELINDFPEYFPGPSSMLDQFGNFVAEHPYASAGLGAGALITTSVLAEAALHQYGDALHTNSVTIPIPAYQNSNLTIPYLNLTIEFLLRGSIQQNVGEPDWIRMNGVIRY